MKGSGKLVMRLLLTVTFICYCIAAAAQKTVKVHGEYVYRGPENVSLVEAKRIALERAKIQALADEFGTIVSQTNTSIVKNNNGQADSRFFSLGSTEVKGEWIADEGEPEYTFDINKDDGTLIVTCRVCGKAREIVSAQTEFVAKVLRNGTEEKFESSTFNNGDDMFLYFQSPVDGYVAVYLVDETPTAYCLLPYRKDGDGQQPVRHGQKYVFFSPKHAGSDAGILDEYTLTCSRALEHNQIYVIFSTQPFTKALDSQEREAIPHQLDYEDFNRWLGNCRKKDTKMGVQVKEITIRGNGE